MSAVFMRLGGQSVYDARAIAQDLQDGKLGDYQPPADFWKCNTFIDRRGRKPSMGYLLMCKSDVRKLKDGFSNTLEIHDGQKVFKQKGLGVINTEAFWPNFQGDQTTIEGTLYIVTVADYRDSLIGGNYPRNAKTVTGIEGQSPSDFYNDPLDWAEAILTLLGSIDVSDIPEDELFIIDNLPYRAVGDEWAKAVEIMDRVGASVRIDSDGQLQLFMLTPDSPATRVGDILTGGGWLGEADVPVYVAGMAPSGNYQFGDPYYSRRTPTETPRDLHELRTFTEVGLYPIRDLVGEEGSGEETLSSDLRYDAYPETAHVFGSMIAQHNDRNELVNRDELEEYYRRLARGLALRWLANTRSAWWLFDGLEIEKPGARYGEITYRLWGTLTTKLNALNEPMDDHRGPWYEATPYARHAYGRVIGSATSGPDGEPAGIKPNEYGQVAIQRGETAGGQTTWDDIVVVQAVNVTGRELQANDYCWMDYNYQLGTGGEWMLVTASGESNCECEKCDPCTLAIIETLKMILENMGLDECADLSQLSEICGCEPDETSEPPGNCDDKCGEKGFPEHVWIKVQGARIDQGTATIIPSHIQRDMLAWFNKQWLFSYGGRGSDCEGRMSPRFATDRDCGGKWVRQWTFPTVPTAGVLDIYKQTTVTMQFWVSRANATTWEVGLWRWVEFHDGPLGSRNRDECGQPTTQGGDEIAKWRITTQEGDCHGRYEITPASLSTNAGFQFDVDNVTGFITGRPPGLEPIDFVSKMLQLPENIPPGMAIVAGENTRFDVRPNYEFEGRFDNIAAIEIRDGQVMQIEDTGGNVYGGEDPQEPPEPFVPCGETEPTPDPGIPEPYMPSAEDPACNDVGPNPGSRCIWENEADQRDPGFDIWG